MDRLDIQTKALAVDEDGTIEGIAWPYAKPDRAGDIIRKGALRLPVAELPILRNHDTDAVIGLWTSFEEREDGLHVKGRLDMKSMQARAARSQILTGRLNGLSIGFRDKGSTRSGRTRTLQSVDVRARLTGYAPSELVGGITQGERRFTILAEDLAGTSFASGPQANDRIVVSGNPLAVVVVDDRTARVAGVQIAFLGRAKGM